VAAADQSDLPRLNLPTVRYITSDHTMAAEWAALSVPGQLVHDRQTVVLPTGDERIRQAMSYLCQSVRFPPAEFRTTPV